MQGIPDATIREPAVPQGHEPPPRNPLTPQSSQLGEQPPASPRSHAWPAPATSGPETGAPPPTSVDFWTEVSAAVGPDARRPDPGPDPQAHLENLLTPAVLAVLDVPSYRFMAGPGPGPGPGPGWDARAPQPLRRMPSLDAAPVLPHPLHLRRGSAPAQRGIALDPGLVPLAEGREAGEARDSLSLGPGVSQGLGAEAAMAQAREQMRQTHTEELMAQARQKLATAHAKLGLQVCVGDAGGGGGEGLD